MIIEVFHGSLWHRVLIGAGLTPWAGLYLVLAYAAVGALKSERSPSGSAAGLTADSIGMTFCACWILIAPFILLFLWAFLGTDAFALWGGALATGAASAWLLEEKKQAIAGIACGTTAVALFALGLSVGMP